MAYHLAVVGDGRGGGRDVDVGWDIATRLIEWLERPETGEPTEEEVARRIHEGWAEYVIRQGRTDHSHVHDTWEDHHAEGRAEHLTQARFLLEVWRRLPSA